MFLLDSCAIIAFLMDENGADEVARCFESGECCTLSINYMEIFLDLLRRRNTLEVDAIVDDLNKLFTCKGIKVIESVPVAVAQTAALRKHEVTHSRDERGKKRTISWGDCFVYAFAEEYGMTLVTGDHEFLYLADIHPNVSVQFFKESTI